MVKYGALDVETANADCGRLLVREAPTQTAPLSPEDAPAQDTE